MSEDGKTGLYVEFTQEDYAIVREAAQAAGYAGENFDQDYIRDAALRATREPGPPQDGEKRHWFTEDELASLVFQVGGASIGVAMQDYPNYIMPSERVTEAIHAVMKSEGHDISDVPGYRPNKATAILRSVTTKSGEG